MSVKITLFDDLEAVAADAAGGLDRAAQPSLFARLEWFRLLQAHCPPEGRLLVARAARGTARAWLFLAIKGTKASAYAAWYSLRVDPIGDPGDDVMTAIGRALRDRGVSEIDLAPIGDPEPLRRGLEAAGWIVRVEPRTGNWRIRTEGLDFAAYWANRPAQLRNTAKRRAKAAGTLEISIHDRFNPGAWDDYEAVYRASWKPEEGSFPFLRALAEQEGAAGTLRLGIARKDGVPIAAQLWLVENGEAVIHKLAYSEASKALSPGTLLGMAMFRHALERDRVGSIDYGTGDEGYKADWMDERRELWRVTAYNPRTVSGLLAAARAKASQLVARLRSR